MASGQREGGRRKTKMMSGWNKLVGKLGKVRKIYLFADGHTPSNAPDSELQSLVAHGPVGTGVGDRLGRPQGAVSILLFSSDSCSSFFCSARFVKCTRVAKQQKKKLALPHHQPNLYFEPKMATVTFGGERTGIAVKVRGSINVARGKTFAQRATLHTQHNTHTTHTHTTQQHTTHTQNTTQTTQHAQHNTHTPRTHHAHNTHTTAHNHTQPHTNTHKHITALHQRGSTPNVTTLHWAYGLPYSLQLWGTGP